MDISKIDNCIQGQIIWESVTLVKSSLNSYVIAQTRYLPDKMTPIYGFGANGSVYYPLAGWIGTDGNLNIVPQHDLEIKSIIIQFIYNYNL